MSGSIKFNNFKNFQNQYNEIKSAANAKIVTTNPISPQKNDEVVLNNAASFSVEADTKKEPQNVVTPENSSNEVKPEENNTPENNSNQAKLEDAKLNNVKEDNDIKAASQDVTPVNLPELDKKFAEAKRQNGWIEKIADGIKNVTNIGLGSKKLNAIIESAKRGEITPDEAGEKIKEYRRKQENIMQATGDVLSVAAVSLAFFKVKNLYNKNVIGFGKLNESTLKSNIVKYSNQAVKQKTPILKKVLKGCSDAEGVNKMYNKIISKKAMNIVATIPAIFVGGLVKKYALKLNRAFTKQYDPNYSPDMESDEKKVVKKLAKKNKKNANFRNNISGMINGLAMPIVGLMGPVGVPVYLLVNSLNRYFIASKEDKTHKTPSNYIRNLKESPLAHVASAAIMAFPLIKNASYSTKLSKSIDSAVEKIKASNPTKIEEKSVIGQLNDILFDEYPEVADILKDGNITTAEKIKELFQQNNIFALKHLQILSEKEEDGYSAIAKVLKEDCPIRMGQKPGQRIEDVPIEIAQDFVNRSGLKGKYTLQRFMSSGTVAETYLAKDSSGKEVVIKVLHDNINADVINNDYNNIVAVINSSNRSDVEKQYLIKNLEGIKNSILEEINLEHEMQAAKDLSLVTKQAHVVKPIEATSKAYVMEKADGVSLRSLNEFMSISTFKFQSKADAEVIVSKYKKSEGVQKAEKEFLESLSSSDDADLFLKTDYFGDIGYPPGINKYIKHVSPRYEKAKIEDLNYFKENMYSRNRNESYTRGKALYEEIYDKYKDISDKFNKFKDALKDDNINYGNYLAAKKYIRLVDENPGIETLSPKEATRMRQQLNEVVNEQYERVLPKDNIIHGDIHSGNVFIDIKKLKQGKDKKFFTLIDTGNVKRLSKEKALRTINLEKYVENGDVENITKFVLEGATLGKMSYDDAYKKLYQELYDIFYSLENGKARRTGRVTKDNILTITDNIMKKHDIVPLTDQGDLIKARASADTSVKEIEAIYSNRRLDKMGKDYKNMVGDEDELNIAAYAAVSGNNLFGWGKDWLVTKAKNIFSKNTYRKRNIMLVPPKDRKGFKISKNTPKSNSELSMIYHLKQGLIDNPLKGTPFEDIDTYSKTLELIQKYKKYRWDVFGIDNCKDYEAFKIEFIKLLGEKEANKALSMDKDLFSNFELKY